MNNEVSRYFSFRVVWNWQKGNKKYYSEKISEDINTLLQKLQTKGVIVSYRKVRTDGSTSYEY